jgi:hypothetical protein
MDDIRSSRVLSSTCGMSSRPTRFVFGLRTLDEIERAFPKRLHSVLKEHSAR